MVSCGARCAEQGAGPGFEQGRFADPAPQRRVRERQDDPGDQGDLGGERIPAIRGRWERGEGGLDERPRRLGLYVFTEDEDVADRILEATNSGDACVNDCSVHPLVPELPFGGVGNSGMGKYHGRWGFEAFTNARGVLYHSARIDPGVKYPPYSEHIREREAMQKLL